MVVARHISQKPYSQSAPPNHLLDSLMDYSYSPHSTTPTSTPTLTSSRVCWWRCLCRCRGMRPYHDGARGSASMRFPMQVLTLGMHCLTTSAPRMILSHSENCCNHTILALPLISVYYFLCFTTCQLYKGLFLGFVNNRAAAQFMSRILWKFSFTLKQVTWRYFYVCMYVFIRQ